eukprot:4752421-Prymnesium_polylepis.1
MARIFQSEERTTLAGALDATDGGIFYVVAAPLTLPRVNGGVVSRSGLAAQTRDVKWMTTCAIGCLALRRAAQTA